MSNVKNNTPAPPVSSEHKWGLISLARKFSWVGLSEREFAMIYEVSVASSPDKWWMWHAGWSEWKPVTQVQKFWTYQVPPADADLPKPPPPAQAKSKP
jgi:hypothetical protein